MADFFSCLAERALGAVPVVRPNLPSAFAPQPMLETSVEVVAPPTRATNYASTQIDRPQSLVDSTTTDERAPGQQPMEAQRRQPPSSFLPIEEGRAGKLSSENFGVTTEPDAPEISSLQRFAADASYDHGRSAPISKRESRDAIAERIVTSPARAAVSDVEKFSSRRFAAAPSVQVTIGRVEVRAVPIPPAARVAERKSPPLLSLDQYLRERNEGRR